MLKIMNMNSLTSRICWKTVLGHESRIYSPLIFYLLLMSLALNEDFYTPFVLFCFISFYFERKLYPLLKRIHKYIIFMTKQIEIEHEY